MPTIGPRPRGQCKALFPCSCCWPGSNFALSGVATFAFTLPSLGLSGSVSIYRTDFLYFRENAARPTGPDGPLPCPDGANGCTLVSEDDTACFYCCAPPGGSCCVCSCGYQMASGPFAGSTADCDRVYLTCADLPTVGTIGGKDVKLAGVEFGCTAECVPYVRFQLIYCEGGSPVSCPIAGVLHGSTLDTAGMVYRCPSGLSLQWNGIGCEDQPEVVLDPDGTVTITADRPVCGPPGGEYYCPCPDEYPCPDDGDTVACWNPDPPNQNATPPGPAGHCGKCDLLPDNADCAGSFPEAAAMVAAMSDAEVDAALAAELSRRA